MSNDSKLPEKQKRNYKSVVDCVARIAKEEGVTKLWTGAQVTVLRAMLLSACALAFTSEIKLRLTGTGIFGETGQIYGGVPLLFCATLVSSFIANIVSNPVSRSIAVTIVIMFVRFYLTARVSYPCTV
jgi:solute carrier family 25 oxoglutarate transporter 11